MKLPKQIVDLLKKQEQKINEQYEQIKRLESDVEAKDFWEDIVVKDNTLDVEQVKKELEDFKFIMQQISEVYSHITDGNMSKCMYTAKTVIAVFDDCRTKEIDEAIAEATKDLREEIEALETVNTKYVITLKSLGLL